MAGKKKKKRLRKREERERNKFQGEAKFFTERDVKRMDRAARTL